MDMYEEVKTKVLCFLENHALLSSQLNVQVILPKEKELRLQYYKLQLFLLSLYSRERCQEAYKMDLLVLLSFEHLSL